MNHHKLIWRVVVLLVVVAVVWVSVAEPAMARGPAKKTVDDKGGAVPWLAPYAIVVMSIGLGMMLVCRSARRRDRARPEAYEGNKLRQQGDD